MRKYELKNPMMAEQFDGSDDMNNDLNKGYDY